MVSHKPSPTSTSASLGSPHSAAPAAEAALAPWRGGLQAHSLAPVPAGNYGSRAWSRNPRAPFPAGTSALLPVFFRLVGRDLLLHSAELRDCPFADLSPAWKLAGVAPLQLSVPPLFCPRCCHALRAQGRALAGFIALPCTGAALRSQLFAGTLHSAGLSAVQLAAPSIKLMGEPLQKSPAWVFLPFRGDTKDQKDAVGPALPDRFSTLSAISGHTSPSSLVFTSAERLRLRGTVSSHRPHRHALNTRQPCKSLKPMWDSAVSGKTSRLCLKRMQTQQSLHPLVLRTSSS